MAQMAAAACCNPNRNPTIITRHGKEAGSNAMQGDQATLRCTTRGLMGSTKTAYTCKSNSKAFVQHHGKILHHYYSPSLKKMTAAPATAQKN